VTDITIPEGPKEAVKTYMEQTKLLVTLSSAFVLAPAATVGIYKDRATVGLTNSQLRWFVISELLFIGSVLAGYVVLGTIAGYQMLNTFDVYRPATKWASLIQIAAYLAGLGVFIYLALALVTATPTPPTK
jgi:hypothetical protein